MKQNFLKKLIRGVLAGLFSGFFVWILSQIAFKSFFYRMEAQTLDWRMRRAIEQPAKPIEDVIIIDVDERSVSKLGSYHHWPRTYWANLIHYLNKAGVKMIGTDFIFDPDRRHPQEDKLFRQAIADAGNVCSALYLSSADSEHFRYAMPEEPEGLEYQKLIHSVPEDLFQHLMRMERLEPEDPVFLNASSTAGYVNLFPDPDGVLRRIPLFLRFNEHVYASFATQMALKQLNIRKIDFNEKRSVVLLESEEQQIRVPVDSRIGMLIRYPGRFKSFRYISFYDVLMKFIPVEYFKDRIILIGSSLPGLYDLRTTPLQSAYPGVEVNASILYQLLNQQFIYQLSDLSKFAFILLMGLIAGILLIFLRPLGSIILTVIFIFLIIFAGLFSLETHSYWMPVISPLFTVIMAFTTTYMYRYLFEEKDKRQIRRIFSHYVSGSVVDMMLKNPEKVKLGGERKICTALFSDIAGFTTLSEQLDPEELVTLLNEYLTEMTRLIIQNRGMLDKYEGDAIMAIFGAPIEIAEHPELACRSALLMQKRLKELRALWKERGKPALHARIGINTGEMVVGNMGSETRFDYTAIGDAVNLASRLEGANKMYGTEVMIGEQTQGLIRDKFFTRPLDLLRVKGKKKPVKVYELIAFRDTNLSTEFKEMLLQYKKGFENYLMRNWEFAANHFRQALQIKSDDGPSRLYLLRCQEFMKNPPGDDWDGVFVMKTK